jgi:nicotinate-nucleotide pyrophosphorylase (carboxylating)
MKQLPPLDWNQINKLIEMALAEDLSTVGDTTSLSVIPKEITATAILKCKTDTVCAGLDVAKAVFQAVDSSIEWEPFVQDGDHCPKGTIMGKATGNAQALLTAERTVLNFLQRLCGVAQTSYIYAKETSGKTTVLDTRKTTPGWRSLEKFAVAAGGATNHRIGLYDRVMIKDNHRELAGLEGDKGITRSVERARAMFPELEVEVEADTLEEVKEAIEAGADYILLDNMTNEQMAEAVAMNNSDSKLEASGGITIERIAEISKIGVDFISVGALTHSVIAADISMEIK